MMNRYLFILFYFLLGLNCLISNDIDKNRENAITNAIKIVSPAVVGINVTQIKQHISHPFFDPFFEDFFKPRARNYKVKNLGSGIIISNDGYIVTNSHVIEQADEIVVSITGGDTFLGTIIGFDDLTDIALIKILLVTGMISKKPTTSVKKPGNINKIAANAIAAPDIIS